MATPEYPGPTQVVGLRSSTSDAVADDSTQPVTRGDLAALQTTVRRQRRFIALLAAALVLVSTLGVLAIVHLTGRVNTLDHAVKTVCFANYVSLNDVDRLNDVMQGIPPATTMRDLASYPFDMVDCDTLAIVPMAVDTED